MHINYIQKDFTNFRLGEFDIESVFMQDFIRNKVSRIKTEMLSQLSRN